MNVFREFILIRYSSTSGIAFLNVDEYSEMASVSGFNFICDEILRDNRPYHRAQCDRRRLDKKKRPDNKVTICVVHRS